MESGASSKRCQRIGSCRLKMHRSPERFLGDYIVDDDPVSIVLVGGPPVEIEQGVSGARLLQFDRLVDVPSAAMAVGDRQPETMAGTEDSPASNIARSVLVLALAGVRPDDEQAGKSTTDHLLGLAVRKFPWRVLVHCGDRYFGDERFYAFGFRKLDVRTNPSSSSSGDSNCDERNSLVHTEPEPSSYSRWYEYRLSDYKQAPDWLNARFWANPERFLLSDDEDDYDVDDGNDATMDEDD